MALPIITQKTGGKAAFKVRVLIERIKTIGLGYLRIFYTGLQETAYPVMFKRLVYQSVVHV
ncbi:hypothetical protein DYU05_06195 [Mucilaginibacter terrenus]|uniref:Uncharacterized protein n=1 Tax=Mucilaginibacter terrenus TaxID=2482727 RepID=A0A3E2NW47_9SPHI|nr:hypothetical protein DYU05_06195 [Mucilaginibacter terrenus]